MTDEPAIPGTTRSDAVESLLAAVLASPPSKRPERLARACSADPSLATELGRQLGMLARLGLMPLGERVGTPDLAGDTDGHPLPHRLGPFVLGRRLGGGGMGVVHEATDPGTGRRVAVKLVRPELLPFVETRARFQREVAVLADLDHPGLVPVHQYGEDHGVPWYAMPLVAGRSLAAVLQGLAGQDPRRLAPTAFGRPAARNATHAACELVHALATALQHAHGRGVVHRDVKPSNVMLADDGRALLIDFGLAHTVQSDSLTRTGVQPGSLAYMAPEQLRGEPVDARSDVFSLGCVLYELLTLRSPFAADTEQQIRSNVLAANPAPPRLLNPALSWEAAVVCATAMAPEPARRYASAQAFAADLQALLHSLPIAARRAGPLLRLHRFARRRPALTIGLTLGTLLVAGLPTGLYLSELSAREREQGLRHAADLEAGRARAAEAKANTELENQRQIAAFAASVFRRANPEELGGRADILLRDAFQAVVAEVGTHARPYAPQVQATIEVMIAEHFRAMGLPRKGAVHLQRALDLRRQHIGSESPEFAEAAYELGRLARQIGELGHAERMQREALGIRQRVLPPDDPRIAQSWSGLAITLRLQERFAESEQATQEAIGVYSRRFGPDDNNVGICLGNLATLQLQQGRPDDAQVSLDRCLELLRLRHGDQEHADVVRREFQYGLLQCTRGNAAEGLPRMQEAYETMRRLVGGQQPNLTEMATNLGRQLAALGRHAEAEPVLLDAVAMAEREQLGGAEAECALAELLLGTGRGPDAVEMLQLRLARTSSRTGEVRLLLALAEACAALANHADAFAALDRAWDGLAEVQWPADSFRRRATDAAIRLLATYPAAVDPATADRWQQRHAALPTSR
jgi:tetratricopeptide (TPR) repeat protein